MKKPKKRKKIKFVGELPSEAISTIATQQRNNFKENAVFIATKNGIFKVKNNKITKV